MKDEVLKFLNLDDDDYKDEDLMKLLIKKILKIHTDHNQNASLDEREALQRSIELRNKYKEHIRNSNLPAIVSRSDNLDIFMQYCDLTISNGKLNDSLEIQKNKSIEMQNTLNELKSNKTNENLDKLLNAFKTSKSENISFFTSASILVLFNSAKHIQNISNIFQKYNINSTFINITFLIITIIILFNYLIRKFINKNIESVIKACSTRSLRRVIEKNCNRWIEDEKIINLIDTFIKNNYRFLYFILSNLDINKSIIPLKQICFDSLLHDLHIDGMIKGIKRNGLKMYYQFYDENWYE